MAITEITESLGVISIDANAINDLIYYFSGDRTGAESEQVSIAVKNGGISAVYITIGADDDHVIKLVDSTGKQWDITEIYNTAVLRDAAVDAAVSGAITDAIPAAY